MLVNSPLLALIVGLQAIVWPLVRISAALMTMPFLSTHAGNLRIRSMLALSLAFLVLPTQAWPTAEVFSAGWLVGLASEILIGALIGLALQVVSAAIVVAGQAISSSLGLSMASMIDPTLGNVPELAQFLVVMGTLIFFGLGGHLVAIELIAESFRLVPPGSPGASLQALRGLFVWSSMMFSGALLIALPVLAALLLVNIGLGIITRAAPSLNIFAVGFPATVASGLLIFVFTLSGAGNRMVWLWRESFDRVRTILGAA